MSFSSFIFLQKVVQYFVAVGVHFMARGSLYSTFMTFLNKASHFKEFDFNNEEFMIKFKPCVLVLDS